MLFFVSLLRCTELDGEHILTVGEMLLGKTSRLVAHQFSHQRICKLSASSLASISASVNHSGSSCGPPRTRNPAFDLRPGKAQLLRHGKQLFVVSLLFLLTSGDRLKFIMLVM